MERFRVDQVSRATITVVEVDGQCGRWVVEVAEDETVVSFVFRVQDGEGDSDGFSVAEGLLELHGDDSAGDGAFEDGEAVEQTMRSVVVEIVGGLAQTRSRIHSTEVHPKLVIVAGPLVAVEGGRHDKFEAER